MERATDQQKKKVPRSRLPPVALLVISMKRDRAGTPVQTDLRPHPDRERSSWDLATANSIPSDAPLDERAKRRKKAEILAEKADFRRELQSQTESSKELARQAGLPFWLLHGTTLEDTDLTSRSSCPLEEAFPFIPRHIGKVLSKQGIRSLFPIQAAVIPHLFHHTSQLLPADVAVSAPTGSGKTLSYVLPVVLALSQWEFSPPHRLRALVLLPTRDLAIQVADVLRPFMEPCGLSMALLIGSQSLAAEKEQLVRENPFLSAGSAAAGGVTWSSAAQPQLQLQEEGKLLYDTCVDIVIATPGRLFDHLKHTAGFSLDHVRILVLDEVDRLMSESYADWMFSLPRLCGASLRRQFEEELLRNPQSFSCEPAICYKWLYSATLTRNPGKLKAMNLSNPRYFSFTVVHSTKRYVIPETLDQRMLVVEPKNKIAALFCLLQQRRPWKPMREEAGSSSSSDDDGCRRFLKTIVFTSSVVSADRLARVLQALGLQRRVALYSSQMAQSGRTDTLDRFRMNETDERSIDVLVCSDAASRGLDVDNVGYIVSYDPPISVKNYVHRVGRTARAGQSGFALTMLRHEEVWVFKDMLRKMVTSFVKELKFKFDPMEEKVAAAVADVVR